MEPGEFKLYCCKNNMWDISTPIMVGGNKVGNLFLGQFFFEDEEPDREIFRQQALKYGFDKGSYLAALDSVPRWSRETVDTVMRFYSSFANLIATLSFGNIKLAWSIAEKDALIEQLKTGEKRLALAMEMAHMGHWEMDIPTMTFTFNEQFFSLYGTTSAQEGGFTVSAAKYANQFVHPDDLRMVTAEFDKVRAGEHEARPAQLEHRIVQKNGNIRFIIVRYIVMKDKDGLPVKTLGVNQDITERKLAEEALQESEEKHRLLFESMAQGVVYQAPDGVIISANPAAERILGLSFEQMRGKTSMDSRWKIIKSDGSPIDGTEHPAMVALKTGETVGPVVHGVFHPEKNAYIWLSITAIPLFQHGERKPHQVYATFEDITARKKAEDRLQHSELRFKRMLGAIPDMVSIHDHEMNILYSNWQGFAAVPENERLENTKCYRTYRGYDDICPDCRAKNVLVNREPYQEVVKINDELWFDVRIIPLLDESDSVEMFIEWVRDISNLKHNEERLQQAKDAAEAANRAKGEFLANMSHELRTPLNGVLGMLQLLDTDPHISGDHKVLLETAMESGHCLLTIISDILSFAQLDAGKLTIAREPMDIREIVDAVRRAFSFEAESKGIELICSVDEAFPCEVLTDAGRLRQILMNLLSNAIKFTPVGTIRMDASILPVPAPSGDRTALLVVSDTGIGIPESKQDDIFEPFTQVDGSLTRKYQGTGIGLGIVRQLAGLMGGSVCVDSAEGAGTDFYVTIRCGLTNTYESHPGDSEPDHVESLAGFRVLVAEDDRVNMIAAKRFLERMGCTPTGVHDGREALALLAEDDFDCILMDVQMPVMDGLEATRAIRSSAILEDKARIPIIAMTAHALPGDRERFLEAGMDGYIAKPVDFAELENVLARIAKTGRADSV